MTTSPVLAALVALAGLPKRTSMLPMPGTLMLARGHRVKVGSGGDGVGSAGRWW